MQYRFLQVVWVSMWLVLVYPAAVVGAESEGSESPQSEDLADSEVESKVEDVSNSNSDEEVDPEEEETQSTGPVQRLPRSHRRSAVMPDEANRMAGLAAEMQADETVWIGEDEDRFFALFRSESTGYPQGSIILIHENGSQPAQPGVMDGIRTRLPDYGWSTLAISVPELQQTSPPARTRPGYVRWQTTDQDQARDSSNDEAADADSDADLVPDSSNVEVADADSDADPASDSDLISDNDDSANPADAESESEAEPGSAETVTGTLPVPANEEQVVAGPLSGQAATTEDPSDSGEVNDESVESLFATFDSRISSSIRYLKETQGQFNLVLIGAGTGAHFLAWYAQSQLATGKSAAIQAMVFVNADQFPLPAGNLPDLVANLQIPILDLYQGDSTANIGNAKRRMDQASRYHQTDYVQMRIPPLSQRSYNSDNRVIRRVRGWLSRYAKGMEIGKARRN